MKLNLNPLSWIKRSRETYLLRAQERHTRQLEKEWQDNFAEDFGFSMPPREWPKDSYEDRYDFSKVDKDVADLMKSCGPGEIVDGVPPEVGLTKSYPAESAIARRFHRAFLDGTCTEFGYVVSLTNVYANHRVNVEFEFEAARSRCDED